MFVLCFAITMFLQNCVFIISTLFLWTSHPTLIYLDKVIQSVRKLGTRWRPTICSFQGRFLVIYPSQVLVLAEQPWNERGKVSYVANSNSCSKGGNVYHEQTIVTFMQSKASKTSSSDTGNLVWGNIYSKHFHYIQTLQHNV